MNIFYLKWLREGMKTPSFAREIGESALAGVGRNNICEYLLFEMALGRQEDIHIYYSCQPLPVQIHQFYVQNFVFSCLPKVISNRRYSNILFLPTPKSPDSPILCAKFGVFMPSQKHFK